MKTINKVFLILLVSLAASTLFAQTAIDTFVQKVEGAGDLTATVQAADGGYVTTSRIDNTSFLVRRIKASGQKKWERRLNLYGGFEPADSFSSRITGITQTTDGGFVLAGYTGCENEVDCGRVVSGPTLVKLRANGAVDWKRIMVSGYGHLFASVIPMSDGGVIAIGARGLFSGSRTLASQLIVRVTSTGDVVWEMNLTTAPAASYKRFGLPLITSTATPDDGFIVAFPTITTASNSTNGIGILKITNSGNVVWGKRLKARSFVFPSVGPTADGGVIIAGARKNSNKLKVVVLTADGTLNWKAGYFLKVPGELISVSSPIQTLDGGYVLTGSTYRTSGKKSYGFIAKIDSSRKVEFQNTFGGHVAGAIFATADGGSLLFSSSVGSNPSDLLVSKVNSEGIVDGCDFFQSLGPTTQTSFGNLGTRSLNIAESADVSFEPFDFGVTSVVANQPVSTECN